MNTAKGKSNVALVVADQLLDSENVEQMAQGGIAFLCREFA